MYSLINQYNELPIPNGENNLVFSAEKIPGYHNHRIGKTISGSPSLLIQVDHENLGTNSLLPQRLYNLTIFHRTNCEIQFGEKREAVEFSIISYTGDNENIKEYFLEISELILKNLGDRPTTKQLKQEVSKIVNLFKSFKAPAKTSIQGLWAELILIEQSENISDFINGWHNDPYEKIDFNFGKNRIEVKSSSFKKREHFFSLEQLTPPAGATLHIASIFAIESTGGESIGDLLERIKNRLVNYESKYFEKVKLITFMTLGQDIILSSEVRFDYYEGISSIYYIKAEDIPSIPSSSIPAEISNVKFRVRLDEVPGSPVPV